MEVLVIGKNPKITSGKNLVLKKQIAIPLQVIVVLTFNSGRFFAPKRLKKATKLDQCFKIHSINLNR